jgi:hypothetical protein
VAKDLSFLYVEAKEKYVNVVAGLCSLLLVSLATGNTLD